MVTNSLLACPFCVRSDLLGFEPTGEGGFLAVKCRACGTHGPAKLSTDEREATAHWNRRAAHEPPADEQIDYAIRRIEECELSMDDSEGLVSMLRELKSRRAAPPPAADLAIDRAYYNGAHQAAAMAHQSLKAMDEWNASGCGGRGPSLMKCEGQS